VVSLQEEFKNVTSSSAANKLSVVCTVKNEKKHGNLLRSLQHARAGCIVKY
jgi:hypothetical protein